MQHVCCGFEAPTVEEIRAHMKVCPEILKFRHEPARIVNIGGSRIVAGHPDAVKRYFEERV